MYKIFDIVENRGLEKGIYGIIKLCKEFGLSFDETAEKVMQNTDKSQEEAEELVRKYWVE